MLSAARKKQLKELIEKLELEISPNELFDEALTHQSFNFEVNKTNEPDYERLEFLGDSVLRLIISDYLFDKYKNYDEGKLTKIRSYLVSDNFLSKIAFSYNVNDYLNIGIHEERDGGRNKESIVACAMEAIFGAVYKLKGFSYVRNFIFKIYDKLDFNESEILYTYNSKEILQQYTQGKNKDLPEYILTSETGESHNKLYEIKVYYHNEELGTGCGKTKKEAEKKAALNAIKKLKVI